MTSVIGVAEAWPSQARFRIFSLTLCVTKCQRWRRHSYLPIVRNIEGCEDPMHHGMIYDSSLPRFPRHDIADMPERAILA